MAIIRVVIAILSRPVSGRGIDLALMLLALLLVGMAGFFVVLCAEAAPESRQLLLAAFVFALMGGWLGGRS